MLHIWNILHVWSDIIFMKNEIFDAVLTRSEFEEFACKSLPTTSGIRNYEDGYIWPMCRTTLDLIQRACWGIHQWLLMYRRGSARMHMLALRSMGTRARMHAVIPIAPLWPISMACKRVGAFGAVLTRVHEVSAMINYLKNQCSHARIIFKNIILLKSISGVFSKFMDVILLCINIYIL